MDCCSAGCLCPPRLECTLLRSGKESSCRSSTGEKVQTAGQQLIALRTADDDGLIPRDFEVARQSYQPDALIAAAGNLTSNGCRIAVDDDGGYGENKATGQRIAVRKRTNSYDLMVDVVDHDQGFEGSRLGASSRGCVSDDHAEALVLCRSEPCSSLWLRTLLQRRPTRPKSRCRRSSLRRPEP